MFVDDYGNPSTSKHERHLGDRVVFIGCCIIGVLLAYLWLSGALN